MGEREEKEGDDVKLEGKDYLAITLAALETFLLPMVILVAILLVLALVLAVRL